MKNCDPNKAQKLAEACVDNLRKEIEKEGACEVCVIQELMIDVLFYVYARSNSVDITKALVARAVEEVVFSILMENKDTGTQKRDKKTLH
jgi:hypothetical protein